MRCVNPVCGLWAHDIFAGTLWCLEQEVPLDARIEGDEGGFPVCVVPTRYLWLCPACSRTMRVRGWTPDEVIFGPSRPQAPIPAAMPLSKGMAPRSETRAHHLKDRLIAAV